MLDPSQTAVLLDHLVYEQVMGCIDLDALFDIEQSITLLTGDLDGVGADRAADLAKVMLDRALARLPDDMRRYLRAARWMSCDGCEICEAEVREATRAAPGDTQRRSRFKS
jgi:hypothetical protein